jgi:hypothetical protein
MAAPCEISKCAEQFGENYKIYPNLCQPSFSAIFNAFNHYAQVDLNRTFCYGTGDQNLRKGKI